MVALQPIDDLVPGLFGQQCREIDKGLAEFGVLGERLTTEHAVVHPLCIARRYHADFEQAGRALASNDRPWRDAGRAAAVQQIDRRPRATATRLPDHMARHAPACTPGPANTVDSRLPVTRDRQFGARAPHLAAGGEARYKAG